MSKKWYPVIDITTCAECGECVKLCQYGVYNKEKAPAPVVVFTEGCIEGCHGCGNLCPTGSITYVGENTDWTPPKGKGSTDSCCSCGSNCC